MNSKIKTARPRAQLRAGRRDWFRIENKGAAGVEVFIYDEIGYWGVTANEFVKQLMNIDEDSVTLRINSPGGEVFDGIAIYNAIREHKATVTGRVDGLAASAASFILMACDNIEMTKNSTLMIHEGHGLCVGNAADMKKTAELLDKTSANIASIYAERAGGDVEEWREAMREESWYSADEAVAVGLADSVLGSDSNTDNSWDLSIFAYGGRSDAPSPVMPVALNRAPVPPTEDKTSETAPEIPVPENDTPEEPINKVGAELMGSVTEFFAPKPVPVAVAFDPDIFRETMYELTHDMKSSGEKAPPEVDEMSVGLSLGTALREALI